MKYILSLESFIMNFEYDDLYESITVWYQNILNAVGAEEMDIKTTLGIKGNTDLEYLNDNSDFIEMLSKNDLRVDGLESTSDYETFINKPCRYMMIYNKEQISLANPEYILFQSWNDTLKKWDSTKLYKINGNINKFYDLLTSKTIVLTHNDIKYIYETSNGNEWILKSNNPNDLFKEYMRADEFETMIETNKDIIINITNEEV